MAPIAVASAEESGPNYGGWSVDGGAAQNQRTFDFEDAGKPTHELSGVTAEIGVGYTHDFGNWSVGGKVVLSLGEMTNGGFDGDFIYQTSSFKGAVGIRGVVGYELGDGMLSVEAGPTWGSFETTQECRRVIPRGWCSTHGGPDGFFATSTEIQQGFSLAVAYEHPIGNNVTVGLRVGATRYERQEYDLGLDGVGGQIPLTTSAETDQISGGFFFAYRPGLRG